MAFDLHNKSCARLDGCLAHNDKLDIHIGCDDDLFVASGDRCLSETGRGSREYQE